MKKKILTMSLVLFGSFELFAQNHVVINPPYYFDNLSNPPVQKNLPVPINIDASLATCVTGEVVPNDPFNLVDGYDGNPAVASSNMMLDTDGNILFFIVDGVIFNKNGVGVAVLPSGVESSDYTGSNEITIVPDPGNCEQFYIFENEIDDYSLPGSFSGTTPSIVLYNAAEENIISNYALNSLSTGGLFTVNGSVKAAMGYGKWARPSVGATNIQSDGSYYTVFSLGNYIEVVQITASGIFGKLMIEKGTPQGSAGNFTRPILEIYEDPNTFNKIVAISEHRGSNQISLYTFDSEFLSLISETAVQLNDDAENPAFVKGLEFSPNGQYLYATHVTTPEVPGSMFYIDVLNPVTYTNLPVPLDLQFSEIEVINFAGAKSFIVAHAEGIERLSDPNNPGMGVFTNLQLFSNYVNFGTVSTYMQLNETRQYQLPDQIDNMDYSELKYMYYDAETFSACASATWEPNTVNDLDNNPFSSGLGNIVYIKDELRIPAGMNITIKNMTFKFAPEAKVIVERSPSPSAGTGGKLILQNSKFTVDDRCVTDDMWQGVEVWGHPSIAQTTTNTKQGTLIVSNNSIIEHAYIAALAGKKINASFDATFQGGIIMTNNNAKFYNNQRGVLISGSASNWIQTNQNISSIINTTFLWEGNLKKASLQYMDQCFISSTKGINFLGNDFINASLVTDNAHYLKGVGLIAYNSIFTVKPRCINPGCTTIDRNTFTSLENGLIANNYNQNTFLVDKTDFTNCRIGLSANYATFEQITRNRFKIHETTNFQTAGLVLNNSTGYKVTENDFKNINNTTPITGARDYGIVVYNSGVANNEIYKNTFSNLKIGGQTEGVNAIEITPTNIPNTALFSMSGLVWKCNTFNQKIVDADLTVIKGRINYFQGFSGTDNANQALNRSANNLFSEYNSNTELINHDIKMEISQDIMYYHIGDDVISNRYFPLNSTGEYVNVTENTNNGFGNHVSMNNQGCPTQIIGGIGPIELKDEIKNIAQKIQNLKDKIDGGDTHSLLTYVSTVSDINASFPLLMQFSPYLSDEVLAAFISRSPQTGKLKQILIANSKLSAEITEKYRGLNLPSGTMNQINAAQVDVSERDMLYDKIRYKESVEATLYYELYHLLQMDSSSIDTFIVELEKNPKLEMRKKLLDMYIQKGDFVKEQTLKNNLISEGVSQEFIDVMEIQKELKLATSELIAVQENPALLTNIETLKNDALDEMVKAKAENMLTFINQQIYNEVFLEFNNNSNQKHSKPVETIFTEISEIPVYVKIYPNPASGKVNLDFQNIPDGKMEVQFIDLTGKVVYNNVFENSNGELIDISEVQKGLYLVKVLIDHQIVEVQKLEVK